MSKWVEDNSEKRREFEIDYYFKRNIVKLGIIGIAESIRIVKYPPDGYYITSYENTFLSHKKFIYVLYEKCAMSKSLTGALYRFVYKTMERFFNKEVVIIDFSEIIKSKYMNFDFVKNVIRKHSKEFTRDEKLKELGI